MRKEVLLMRSVLLQGYNSSSTNPSYFHRRRTMFLASCFFGRAARFLLGQSLYMSALSAMVTFSFGSYRGYLVSRRP